MKLYDKAVFGLLNLTRNKKTLDFVNKISFTNNFI